FQFRFLLTTDRDPGNGQCGRSQHHHHGCRDDEFNERIPRRCAVEPSTHRVSHACFDYLTVTRAEANSSGTVRPVDVVPTPVMRTSDVPASPATNEIAASSPVPAAPGPGVGRAKARSIRPASASTPGVKVPEAPPWTMNEPGVTDGVLMTAGS